MHDVRLRAELLTGRRALLAGSGVGLHHSGNLVNALRHLGDSVGLGLHGLGHIAHHHHHASGQLCGLLQGLCHLAHHVRAVLHSGNGILDQIRGGLGRLVGLGRQVAHLIGHNGEALSSRARPGGLHSGVQRQNVGLESDVFNGGNDLADLLRGGGDIVHGDIELLNVLVAGGHLTAGLLHAVPGFLSGRGGLLGGIGDIGNGGAELLHGAGLLGSTLSQGLGAVGHLVRPGGHLVRRLGDVGNRLAHADDELVDAVVDGFQIAGEAGGQLHVEVALGHLVRAVRDILNDAVKHLLAGTQGVAHLAQLVLAHKAHGDGQVALAEAHQSTAHLRAGLNDTSDDPNRHQQHHHSGNHHHADDADDLNSGIAVLLINNFLLRGGQRRGQIVSSCSGSHQLGGAGLRNHGNSALAVCTGCRTDLVGLLTPLCYGGSEGIQQGLVVQGINVPKLLNVGFQLAHLAESVVNIAHIAGEHRVPQASGGDIVGNAALGRLVVGLYVLVDNVGIGTLLGAHHHQAHNNDSH